MAKAYIANKPVRFDRNYAVGEVIPDEVIEPTMTRKLVEMGRIISVDLPDTGDSAEKAPAPPPDGDVDGAEGEGGTNTQGEPEAPVEGAEDGTETPPESEGEPDPEPDTAPAPEASGEPSTEPEAEPEPEAEAGGEFVCPVCGKAFGSKNALSAHSRSHKE